MDLNKNQFPIQVFLSEILLHIEKKNDQELHDLFKKMIAKPPPLNPPLKKKSSSFQQDLETGIQSIPSSKISFKTNIDYLAHNVDWNDASRGVPEFTVKGYSVAEVIGKSGVYFHESLRLGLYIQPPSFDYPAHAHDAEEWYLILSGHAEWQIDGVSFQAQPGQVFRHPPEAGHRMITFNDPLLAIWIWTGAIEGRYWFVGHEEINCQLK